jgi:hypothetical protein
MRDDMINPCACVYRAIFRACYARFRDCLTKAGHAGTVKLEFTGGRAENKQMFGRKNEEYVADFQVVARRVMTTQLEQDIFRFHFLLAADAGMCAKRLGMSKDAFFHAVDALETKLGNVFSNLEPYALYPLDEYFSHVLYKGEAPKVKGASVVPEIRTIFPLRPPLAFSAA